jgi:dipeptidyl-peptidase III
MAVASIAACSRGETTPAPAASSSASAPAVTERKYLLERVADAAVVQVYADGFEKLPLKEKQLVWHL